MAAQASPGCYKTASLRKRGPRPVRCIVAVLCYAVQVFTSVAQDVMQRLQQEQADQQSAATSSPIKLTSNLDKAKQRRRKGCCEA